MYRKVDRIFLLLICTVSAIFYMGQKVTTTSIPEFANCWNDLLKEYTVQQISRALTAVGLGVERVYINCIQQRTRKLPIIDFTKKNQLKFNSVDLKRVDGIFFYLRQIRQQQGINKA